MTDRWASRLLERESEVDTMSKSKHNHEVKDYSAKAPIIEEIKNLLDSCQSAVIVDYRGLTVEEDTALRKKFRESGVVYKVLKNTYIKRAADELGITGLDADLNGPTAVAFGIQDPAAPAKILKEFIADKKKMTVKCGIVDKQYIDANGVKALADLPSREVLIAKMLGSMNAPITGLVSVLGGTVRKLLYALNAVADSKNETAA